MTLTLQPVRVQVLGAAEEGCLVFADGVLAAVLTRLSEQHGEMAGSWFLEHGFGALDGPEHPVFSDLDAARRWTERRLGHETPPRQPSR